MKPFLCNCDKTSKINSLVSKKEGFLQTEEQTKGAPTSLTSLLFDTNSPCTAILTVHLPTSQIIVVNSTACEILNYSASELCSMKLENIIHESYRHKLIALQQEFLKETNETLLNREKLIELINRDGEGLPVFFYLRKIDNSPRCLAVAEPLVQKTGLVSLNENGKILSCDEDFAFLFEYDASELVGAKINILLPGIKLPKKWHKKPVVKQKITGKTRGGEIFPVSLTANSNPSSEVLKVFIRAYNDLSGLIFLNSKLLISHFTKYVVKLLLGYSKKEIVNQHILNIIPNFCQEEEGNEKKEIDRLNGKYRYCELNGASNELDLDYSGTENSKEQEYESNFKTLYEHNMAEKRICERTDLDDPGEKKKSFNILDQLEVKEGKYVGFAKHKDESLIEVQYQVRVIKLSDEFFYCIWLAKDRKRNPDLYFGKSVSNVTLVSSINSISLDESVHKGSGNSEQFTRPSTASIISQADEVLTAGDYSANYTNIKQIGKGAFGYVKMAYRNSDGLLVVTKFIKKKKINVRSWVYHASLNMKIPLEISFLTTLEHPNIVKVLDVFHNDSFVQLVMEKHGAGFDLFEFIDRGPNCDEKLKSYIFRQIISAVYYLNSLGILHRDIKEENVIINEKFEIKLIDFGSATFIPHDESFSIFYGTVEYCSPEVLQGSTYKGPELEIWALGVTLYVLTFGKNPFFKFEEIIKGKFTIPAPISDELNDLLHRMLDKNIHTRITIDKVAENVWINQPVCIENYRFDEVVRCSDEEAYPPKYIQEIRSDDYYFKIDSLADSDQLLDTNKTSNSSLQNITMEELGDLDENFQELHKAVNLDVPADKKFNSSVFCSTPAQKCENRVCKSSTGLRKHYENYPGPNDKNHRHRHSDSMGGKANSQESIFSGFDDNPSDTSENIQNRDKNFVECSHKVYFKKRFPSEKNCSHEELSDISADSFEDYKEDDEGEDEEEDDDDDDDNDDGADEEEDDFKDDDDEIAVAED